MLTKIEAISSCPNCGSNQPIGYNFCGKCGQPNFVIEKEKDEESRRNIKYLLAYIISLIIMLIAGGFTEDSLFTATILTVAYAFFDLAFASIQPRVWNLLLPKLIHFKPLIAIIIIAIVSGFVVSFLMDNLNYALFGETYSLILPFMESNNPLLFGIIIIGVFPAFFEELAFRGFVYNNLDKIAGKKSAMWGSTFLFGLVHFSLLSLIWIIPFGLMLAYFRNKYSTLLYGIVGHFTHNTTSVLIEYYRII